MIPESWKTWPIWAWALLGLAVGAAIGALAGYLFNGACIGVTAGVVVYSWLRGARNRIRKD